jgi:quinol monooxygenase YgiN
MKPIVLVIKFTTNAENKEEFKRILIELFNQICKERTFIDAVLQEGIQKPEEILVYETWDETVEDFLKVHMVKDYRLPFEQALSDLEITREPTVYIPFAQWENPNATGLRNFCVDQADIES